MALPKTLDYPITTATEVRNTPAALEAMIDALCDILGITRGASITTVPFEKLANKDALNGYCGLDAGGLIGLARMPTGIERAANKGAANGYCGLDAGGRVELARLPVTLTGISADQVDGYHAADFAAAVHTHVKAGVTDLETISTTPGAARVPKADGLGKIAAGWLPSIDHTTLASIGTNTHAQIDSALGLVTDVPGAAKIVKSEAGGAIAWGWGGAPPYLTLTLASDVSISSGADTDVAWGHEVDDHGFHAAASKDVLLPATAYNGTYLLFLQVEVGAHASAVTQWQLRMKSGGSVVSLLTAKALVPAASGKRQTLEVVALLALTSETISISVHQDSGGTLTLYSDGSRLQLVRIGA